MKKSKPRQLLIDFTDSPQGGEEEPKGDESPEDTSLLFTSASNGRPASTPLTPGIDHHRLMEAVALRENLAEALRQVVRNKGAPGVDRQSVEDVDRHAALLLPRIQDALLKGTYQPGDIRRVWIPKSSGGQRGLGIPNVIDRWVAQAILRVMEPIWDPTFHDSSHGFRPNRGAQTAIAQASRYQEEGYRYVVDLDLSNFFDRVHHQRLLSRLEQKIKDRRLIRLIQRMLKARVVMPDGTRVCTEEGTPQGSPLSPILANIVLDELDQELSRRGHRFVRYADDCQIYVRSERAGHRVMASTQRFIESRLRLVVNAKKSAVDLSYRRHFLGFRVGSTQGGRVIIQLSSRSLERLDARIREFTRRNLGRAFRACLKRLNLYLGGWMAYFRLCTKDVLRTLRYLDAHIRRRLRAILICQKKRCRYLMRALVAAGVPLKLAAATAYNRCGPWAKSKLMGIERGYGNKWFATQLVTLEELWKRHNPRKPTPAPTPPPPPPAPKRQTLLWDD